MTMTLKNVNSLTYGAKNKPKKRYVLRGHSAVFLLNWNYLYFFPLFFGVETSDSRESSEDTSGLTLPTTISFLSSS